MKNIVHAKGGLHNRLTRILALQPFSLYETEAFLQARNVQFSRMDTIELCLCTGGIPYYLEWVRPQISAAQAIEELCFRPTGVLSKEYDSLLSSLFDNSDIHIAILATLARHRYGLERKELLSKSRIAEGGSVTRALKELEMSGFIRRFVPFGKGKRSGYYRLIDEFTLFYHS